MRWESLGNRMGVPPNKHKFRDYVIFAEYMPNAISQMFPFMFKKAKKVVVCKKINVSNRLGPLQVNFNADDLPQREICSSI